MRTITFWSLALILVGGLFSGPLAAGEVEFNRDIRPILADHCLACHGPDKMSRKADLRLDQRDAAVAMGAIVPGQPGESPVIARIDSTDPDEMMPPPAKKRMPEAQKALLKKWISEGAEYQVIRSLLEDKIEVGILCIEFDESAANHLDTKYLQRIEESLQALIAAGFRVIAKEPDCHNYTLVYKNGH